MQYIKLSNNVIHRGNSALGGKRGDKGPARGMEKRDNRAPCLDYQAKIALSNTDLSIKIKMKNRCLVFNNCSH